MPENKHLRFFVRLAYVLLALTTAWLGLRFLLPWLLPFLLALGMSALMEPPVQLLTGRFRLPRWSAAALCTFLLTSALLGGLGLLLWRAGYELTLLLGRLPTLLAGLPTLSRSLETMAYRFLIALPFQVREIVREALERLLAQGIALPNHFYEWLTGMIGGFISALPAVGLFLFTTILSTYFISSSRPQLWESLHRRLPPLWRDRACRAGAELKRVLGGWLRAQGLLMLITFGELTIGFLFLRVDLALLLAGLSALVDALPVFGVGTVLIPWAVMLMLCGNLPLAVGLLILYGVVTLVRSLLEPKLVGSRVGLPPLASLLSMYVGFQAFGIPGMILSPLIAVLLRRLWACGLFRSEHT